MVRVEWHSWNFFLFISTTKWKELHNVPKIIGKFVDEKTRLNEKQKENEKIDEDVVKERVRDLCNAVISIGGRHTANVLHTPSSRLQIMSNDAYSRPVQRIFKE